MSQERRKRPEPRKPRTASYDISPPTSETQDTPAGYVGPMFSDVSADGLAYADDMRRRREASRRLPVLSSGVRDPFGGAR